MTTEAGKQVWKERLSPVTSTLLPKGARPIHSHDWHVWFEVDDTDAEKTLPLWVVGTDHTIPRAWLYVHTFHDRDGLHVWHVYADNSEQKL